MTAADLLQFTYIVSNGDRDIFADILGVTREQVDAWITFDDLSAEIPDSEWLDDYAEIWNREEKEARLLARMTGQTFELNTLGMSELDLRRVEYLREKYGKKN